MHIEKLEFQYMKSMKSYSLEIVVLLNMFEKFAQYVNVELLFHLALELSESSLNGIDSFVGGLYSRSFKCL